MPEPPRKCFNELARACLTKLKISEPHRPSRGLPGKLMSVDRGTRRAPRTDNKWPAPRSGAVCEITLLYYKFSEWGFSSDGAAPRVLCQRPKTQIGTATPAFEVSRFARDSNYVANIARGLSAKRMETCERGRKRGRGEGEANAIFLFRFAFRKCVYTRVSRARANILFSRYVRSSNSNNSRDYYDVPPIYRLDSFAGSV